jgi:arylsulfatase A-like enzyme
MGFMKTMFLLAICWTGCADQAREPDDRIIRLVDLAKEAAFDSYIDLSDERLSLERGGTPLVRDGFEEMDDTRYTVQPAETVRELKGGSEPSGPAGTKPPRLAGEGSGRHIVLAPQEALLGAFPAERNRTYHAEIFVKGDRFEGVWVAFLELSRPFSAPDLQDRERLMESLVLAGSRIHALQPGNTGDDGYRRYAANFHTSRVRTQGLLLAVVSTQSGLQVDDLAVTQLGPFMEQILLRKAEFDHPYVRRINLKRDYRESIVLVAPGEASFRLRIPERNPVFRFSAGTLASTPITATAEVSGGGHSSATHVNLGADSLGASRWWDAQLDLAAFAGEEVRLSLKVRPKDPTDSGTGVAFGRPVILDEPAVEPRPHDVILISLDTMRADRMSLYGAKKPTTPFLERLAPSSMVFDAAIAPAAYTLPSHASMLTGQLPDRIATRSPVRGVNPRSAPLLARAFRDAGYHTMAFTGGGYVDPEFGFESGFERYSTIDLGMVLRRLQSDLDHPSEGALNELSEILKTDAPAPRFIFLHTFAAHNYRSSAEDLLAVGADPEEVPELTRLNREQKPVIELLKDLGGVGPENRERLTVLYDGALRVADAFVEYVVSELEAAGRLDRTLLVIVSDHGEELYEHGGFGHAHQVYEELIWVPFIVRGPGVKPGRSATVVSLVDVAPTLRELCGLPHVPGMDGRSLAPILGGGVLPAEPTIARVCPSKNNTLYALRNDRYKLLVEENKSRVELFNLEEDPGELNDLSPRNQKLCSRLRNLLKAQVDALNSEGQGTAPALSPALMEDLKQLGYIHIDGKSGK